MLSALTILIIAISIRAIITSEYDYEGFIFRRIHNLIFSKSYFNCTNGQSIEFFENNLTAVCSDTPSRFTLDVPNYEKNPKFGKFEIYSFPIIKSVTPDSGNRYIFVNSLKPIEKANMWFYEFYDKKGVQNGIFYCQFRASIYSNLECEYIHFNIAFKFLESFLRQQIGITERFGAIAKYFNTTQTQYYMEIDPSLMTVNIENQKYLETEKLRVLLNTFRTAHLIWAFNDICSLKNEIHRCEVELTVKHSENHEQNKAVLDYILARRSATQHKLKQMVISYEYYRIQTNWLLDQLENSTSIYFHDSLPSKIPDLVIEGKCAAGYYGKEVSGSIAYEDLSEMIGVNVVPHFE